MVSCANYGTAVYSGGAVVRRDTALHAPWSEFLSDEEYAALQSALVANPEAGAIIPGSGGLRKIRWARSGRGKTGGVRVIYYLRTQAGLIWMLTIYAKGEIESIPAHVLRRIAREIEDAEG